MTPGRVRPADLAVATRGVPAAWVVVGAIDLFWLGAVNGDFALMRAIEHSASHADPASRRTYLLNSHGRHFWIRPQEFHLYDRLTTVSLAGLFACVLLMLVLFRGPTIRRLLRQPVFYAGPMALYLASRWFWRRA